MIRLAALSVRVAAAGLLAFGLYGCSPTGETPNTAAESTTETTTSDTAPVAQDKDESGIQSRGLRERPPRPPFPTGPVVLNGAIACAKDQGDPQGTNGRDLSGFIMSAASMTNAQCRTECAARGFNFAGTQAASYCFCGNSYGNSGLSTACASRCSGNPGEICGGIWANSVSITEALPTAPNPPTNGGQCVIDITATGYRHREIQRWEVTGLGVASAPGKLYPVRWTTSGSGFSHTSAGTQQRDAAWSIAGTANVQFRALVRASDNHWLVQQVNSAIRIPNGISGTQQLTMGGVPQNPTVLGAEAFEFQYPPIVAPGNLTVITETRQFALTGSTGFQQPGSATGTIGCQWRFAL